MLTEFLLKESITTAEGADDSGGKKIQRISFYIRSNF